MNTTPFEKLKVTLKSKLIALAMVDRRYYQCIKAFNLAERAHKGFRKDDVTPEFYHQLSMLGLALTFHSNLIRPDLIYTVVLLHDTYEDYAKFIEEIEHDFPIEMEFIKRISKIIHVKQPNGCYVKHNRDMAEYMADIASCFVTSIVKGIDRVNNLSTMKGVFNLKKQLAYALEAETDFLKMLKTARNTFPEQNAVYENIKSILNLLIANTRHFATILSGGENVYKSA